MRRSIILFFSRIKQWKPWVSVRLPRICDVVRTSVVYMAVCALFAALGSSMLAYHALRAYRVNQWDAPKAITLKKQEMPEGADKELPVAITMSKPRTAEQEIKQYSQEEREKISPMQVKNTSDKADTPTISTGARQETMLKPLSGQIRTAYGWREDEVYKDWRFHAGVTIQAEHGSTVYAAKSGKVIDMYKHDSGYSIKITHTDGTVTVYGHIADSDVYVGQQVGQGQPIGRLGSNGEVSLYFEIWLNNRSVDPSELFEE